MTAIPMIGLGTWKLAGDEGIAAVKTALSLDYRHIDTAALYGNHVEIGKAIKGVDRSTLFITSKVWHSDLHHDDLLAACDQALKEIDTPYLDLYLIHWPNKQVPMAESFKALEALRSSGKIEEFGVANFTVRHLEEALRITQGIICNQVEFHPMLYQKELLEVCKRHGIQLVAYSPLGHGRLVKNETVQAIARKHERSASQVVLRWILDKGVAVIPKSSSREHLAENLDLDFTLDDKDTALLDAMPQQRFINPAFAEF